MNAETLLAATNRFKEHYRSITTAHPEIVGVRCMASESEPTKFVIEVLVHSEQVAAASTFGFSASFPLHDSPDAPELEILTVRDETFVAHSTNIPDGFIEAGDSAWGDGLLGSGTLGWSIELDGTLGGISNWHVFCPLGNSTPLGTSTLVKGTRVGSLELFDPVHNGALFDFAFCRYDDPKVASGRMRSCDDGQRLPYPRRLGFGSDLAPGLRYHKAGARSPICRSGIFLGIGEARIDYGFQIVTLREQLYFSKMTDPGDSGSVIVKGDSNVVVGLNCAGSRPEASRQHSIASPLYRKGWSFVGTKVFGEHEIPAFSISSHQRVSANAGPSGSGFLYGDVPSAGSGRLPPIFQAGSAPRYAGMRWHEVDGNPEFRVIQPYGDWVQIRVRRTDRGGWAGYREYDVWVHAPTGSAWTAA